VRSWTDASGEPVGPIVAAGMQVFHGAPMFDAGQIAALDAYVGAHAAHSIPIPVVRTDPSELQRGRQLFEDNCEACHGAAGQGATAGYQWTALPLDRATPTQIGEAIRIGPGVMPRFPRTLLSDEDVSALATYVTNLTHDQKNYGGIVLGDMGPVAEGAIGAFVGLGMLFWVVYFTGTKANGRRLDERGESD
jgi:ubiquinol-cytochrome c reductase cytochrome c subunit